MSSPFDALAGSVISSVQGIFGGTSAFTYSRPQGNKFDAIAPFLITAALDMGGIYSTPNGEYEAGLLVRISDIPLGPKSGDQVVIAHSPALACDGTYKVQSEPIQDKSIGWATLQLRLLPA